MSNTVVQTSVRAARNLAGTDLGYTDYREITQDQVNTVRGRHR